jgi:hypothetical protein
MEMMINGKDGINNGGPITFHKRNGSQQHIILKGWSERFFNVKINSSIYNNLMSLCQKGKAIITYIEQAAEFDEQAAETTTTRRRRSGS